MLYYVLVGVITAVVFGGIGAVVSHLLRSGRTKEKEERAHTLLNEAERSAEAARKDAEVKVRGELLEAREDLEKEGRDLRAEHGKERKRIAKREDLLDSKLSLLDKKEQPEWTESTES